MFVTKALLDHVVARERANPSNSRRLEARVAELAQQERDRRAAIARGVEHHQQNHVLLIRCQPD